MNVTEGGWPIRKRRSRAGAESIVDARGIALSTMEFMRGSAVRAGRVRPGAGIRSGRYFP